ncbi:MAG: thiamine pyrophosphate-dependent enzyme [Actinomycetota bacterium]
MVWNNYAYASIRGLQRGYLDKRELATDFHNPLTGERYNPDFAAMARSCGVEGVRVLRAVVVGTRRCGWLYRLTSRDSRSAGWLCLIRWLCLAGRRRAGLRGCGCGCGCGGRDRWRGSGRRRSDSSRSGHRGCCCGCKWHCW